MNREILYSHIPYPEAKAKMTTSSYYQILASVAVVATATFAIIFLTAGTTTGGISILSLRGNSVQEDQESRQLQVAPLDIDPKTVVLKSDHRLNLRFILHRSAITSLQLRRVNIFFPAPSQAHKRNPMQCCLLQLTFRTNINIT